MNEEERKETLLQNIVKQVCQGDNLILRTYTNLYDLCDSRYYYTGVYYDGTYITHIPPLNHYTVSRYANTKKERTKKFINIHNSMVVNLVDNIFQILLM